MVTPTLARAQSMAMWAEYKQSIRGALYERQLAKGPRNQSATYGPIIQIGCTLMSMPCITASRMDTM